MSSITTVPASDPQSPPHHFDRNPHSHYSIPGPKWVPPAFTFIPQYLPPLPRLRNVPYPLGPPVDASENGPSRRSTSNDGHSIQTFALAGDGILYAAAIRSALKEAGPQMRRNPACLAMTRCGLVRNSTFSHLALSYRLRYAQPHLALMTNGQKSYADLFEAYIGAAWLSASSLGKSAYLAEVNTFLDELYDPRAWTCIEVLKYGLFIDITPSSPSTKLSKEEMIQIRKQKREMMAREKAGIKSVLKSREFNLGIGKSTGKKLSSTSKQLRIRGQSLAGDKLVQRFTKLGIDAEERAANDGEVVLLDEDGEWIDESMSDIEILWATGLSDGEEEGDDVCVGGGGTRSDPIVMLE